MTQGHRRFAALYDRATRNERRMMRSLRREVVPRVHGRVLEIGVGTGANWAYLPSGIDYIGVEPDPYMMERARRNASEQGLALDLREGDVRGLPFEDASFDSALATLVFCSVPDAIDGLREVHRVLRPGGELWFIEHVRQGHAALAGLQSALRPATRYFCGGCEWDHDTLSDMEAAGFVAADVRRRGGLLPHISGSVRR
jgi:SAM-dependent methyltransferase